MPCPSYMSYISSPSFFPCFPTQKPTKHPPRISNLRPASILQGRIDFHPKTIQGEHGFRFLHQRFLGKSPRPNRDRPRVSGSVVRPFVCSKMGRFFSGISVVLN